ncbi:MAG: hypothetical protein Q4G69_14595 [Planctomycetia bacterium]|nr:hypothetical protein [Planctomycetia bacterium]
MNNLFWKRTVDILMIVLLIVLMGCSITGDAVHECLGLLLFVLFAAHHVLNGSWYRTFMNRCRSFRQFFLAFMTVLLFTVMISMAVSSVLVSRTLFAFIDYDGGLFARQFHQMSTHSGLILAAIHFGIYGKRFFLNFRQRNNPQGPARKIIRLVFILLTAAVCVYGIVSSFRHDIGDKLLMRQAYSFWNGSRILFFADYAAVFVLYAVLAHYAAERIFFRRTEKNKSNK